MSNIYNNTIPVEPSEPWLSYIKDSFTYNATAGIVISNKTNKAIGSNCGDGYLKTTLGPIKRFGLVKKNFKIHHLCWYLHWDIWPSLEIDHEDRNRQNNCIDNLRLVHKHENLGRRYGKEYIKEVIDNQPF